MSKYQDVIDVLLEGRPQSSPEYLAKVVHRLGDAVSREATKLQGETNPSNYEAIWQIMKEHPVFDEEMRNLLREVDRMHVLYVYSRFLNSKAVGPPLVKAALGAKG